MELLTIKEAAALTRMSVGWWRNKIFRREVKVLKLGRSVRIPRSVIDEVLRKATVEPRKGAAER